VSVDAHAASDPASSVWVSANAGSGKTKVLTDRVLRLLLNNSNPSKILCLTYTKAAAAEMKNRIYSILSGWVVAEEKELKQTIASLIGKPATSAILKLARTLFAEVIEAPEGIRIQTIHGFCQSILYRFPIEAGVLPNFTVIDELQAEELLNQSLHHLFFSTHSVSKDVEAALIKLSGLLSESSFESLMRQIIKNRSKFQLLIQPPNSLEVMQKRITGRLMKEHGFDADVSEIQIKQGYLNYSETELLTLRSLIPLLEPGNKADQKTAQALAQWLAHSHEERLASLDTYKHAFLKVDDEPFQAKSMFTQAVTKKHPHVIDVLLDEQARVLKCVQACRSYRVAQNTMTMLTIADAILSIYGQLKQKRGLMDFEDLILSVLHLLGKSNASQWVLFKLDGGLDHLLLDEAQDTSPQQWEIIKHLVDAFFHGEGSRNIPRTIFVVGDEKQSIFSFQQADPRAFGDMQDWFSRITKASSLPYSRRPLHISYRSTPPILQVVDQVFADEAVRQGVVLVEKAVTHIAHRKDHPGRVELWERIPVQEKVESIAWDTSTQFLARPKAETLLARRIAGTIRDWFDEGRVLLSTGEPIQPSDIMILVRKRGNLVNPLIRALRRQGIPVAGTDRLILAEHIAVRDMMSLMRFLLLPQDDMQLAIVLRSPLIGLSEQQLFALAYGRGSVSLWDRLKEKSEYRDAYEWLSRALAKTDMVRPFELISMVLHTWGGKKNFTRRLGEEALDPLDELLSQALRYERDNTPSLQGFLHALETNEITIKRDMEQSRNEVRILTVHGSKGLEAPIVFLPDTAYSSKAETQPVYWWEGHENGCTWVPYSDDKDRLTQQLYEEKQQREREENRRLLYVALTRARDEMIVAGVETSKSSEKNVSWYDMIEAGVTPLAKELEHTSKNSKESWKIWRVENEAEAIAGKVKSHNQTVQRVSAFPSYLLSEPKPEPSPTRPLTPSEFTGASAVFLSPLTDSERILRGTLIHTLLQYLPDILPHERPIKIRAYLERKSLPESIRASIEEEVVSLLNNPGFSRFFLPEGLSEVAVCGIVTDSQGKPVVINGQIDRMIVDDANVWIVDYKTGREIPSNVRDVPLGYMKQMQAYQRLLSDIYPQKNVHCSLLWTNGPVWMPLGDEMLNRSDVAAVA
jgi:ATP-dependent helicase/nuclease subunit A